MGETAILPIVGRRLRIIADEYVKPEFGTGALKITPGHDPNDFEIGRKHGLDELTVIGEDGRMTEAAGERFAGMTALEAREAVVAALREEGRINRTEPYTHEVPYSQRSGERIEPLISLQWFMKMDELAGPAIAAVEDGRVRIHPEGQRKRYLDWLRQHPPVVHLAPAVVGPPDPGLVPRQRDLRRHGPAGRARAGSATPTSWTRGSPARLWPFATLGWPDQTDELKAFYPTDVLSTARDILFLWVARMVFMGLEFAGDIPFDDVYVHSVVQAPDGRRMSKSLGHGHRPADADRRRPAPAGVHRGRRLPRLRRRRGPLRAAGDVLDAGRALQRGHDRRGPPARQQALQRVAARAAARARGRDRAGRGAGAGDRRGHLDPLAPAGGGGRGRRGDRALRVPPRHAARCTRFVYGELCDWYLEMLKPRLYAEDNAETADVRAATCWPRRSRWRTR